MPNYQIIYNRANFSEEPESEISQILKDAFEAQNHKYEYFISAEDKAEALQEFVRYFKFFNVVKDSEDTTVTQNELFARAYKATVVFGGRLPQHACVTLDTLINDSYRSATNPVHDVFATLTLPIKVHDLSLTLWREWINGPRTKTALELFPVASDIANKFGPFSKGLALVLTKTYPKGRNLIPGKLYVHTIKDDDNKMGYAFLDETGVLIRGIFDKVRSYALTAI